VGEQWVGLQSTARPLLELAGAIDVAPGDRDPMGQDDHVVHPGALTGLEDAGHRLLHGPFGAVEITGPGRDPGPFRK